MDWAGAVHSKTLCWNAWQGFASLLLFNSWQSRNLSVGFIHKQSLLCTTGVCNYFPSFILCSVIIFFSLILKLKHSAVSTSIDLVFFIYLSFRVLLVSRSGIGKFMNAILLIWVVYPVSCLADFVLLVKIFPRFLFKIWNMKRAAKLVYANESFTTTEYILQSFSWNLNCHKVQVTFLLHLFLSSEGSYITEKAEKEGM